MASLDVERMALAYLRQRFPSPQSAHVSMESGVMCDGAQLADFARQIARACARVAGDPWARPGGSLRTFGLDGKEWENYMLGKSDSATAIRSAVQRGRKRG